MTANKAFTAAAVVITLAATGAMVTTQSPGTPGSALPGISPVEFEEFRIGLEDFLEVEEAEEGLGPAFNGTSCAGCHSIPAVGGTGTIAEVRAGRHNARGEFEPFDKSGETLFHLFSLPTHSCQPIVPSDAAVVARRVPIALFGAGLVEAIPDDTLIALEDPNDRNGDGVSGRAGMVVDVGTGERRVGRFGWKSQHATLLAFSGDAYRNEMGITNDLFPLESAYGVTADRMRACDPIPDPEDIRDPRTRRRGIDNFASFMQFLAPVPRGAVDDQVRAGERVFSAIGCAACHMPVLSTGPSSNPLFNRQPVPLFSDLLLHDVGTGDGIGQPPGDPNELRTPALWGIRFRRPLLHDGSAASVRDAILRHAAEGELARRGFERASDADRAALLAFLRSL
jgi:CxxC motif-containing protein (DUF1111 family)